MLVMSSSLRPPEALMTKTSCLGGAVVFSDTCRMTVGVDVSKGTRSAHAAAVPRNVGHDRNAQRFVLSEGNSLHPLPMFHVNRHRSSLQADETCRSKTLAAGSGYVSLPHDSHGAATPPMGSITRRSGVTSSRQHVFTPPARNRP